MGQRAARMALGKQRAREARAVLEDEDGQAAALARLAARLAEAEPEQREAAQRLLEAIEAFLAAGGAPSLDDSL